MRLELVTSPGQLAEAPSGGQRRFTRAGDPADLAGLLRDLPPPAADRSDLVRRLREYNAQLGNPHGDALCDALEHPRARVVVAGQQPGAFAGPLLLLGKAAAAAAIAGKLAEQHDGPVVPMFWNHSEDHDQDEAARLFVLHQGSIARRRAPLAPARVSLDHVNVGPELRTFAQQVLDELGREDLADLLPRPGAPFPRWTSDVVAACLPDVPLLHAEPRIVRPLLGPLFQRVVAEIEAVGAALDAGTRHVRGTGLEPQVEVRDASPLFLVAPDGRRLRLGYRDGWSLRSPEVFGAGAGYAPESSWLQALAGERPEAFSTNVLLRPVAQQFLFPLVVQVCGPAESAYFEQLPELYAWAGLPRPAVVKRPHVTLLGEREARIREWAGLEAAALLEPAGWKADERVQDSGALPPGFRSGRNARHHLTEWVTPRGRPQERLLGPLTLSPQGPPSRLQRALTLMRPFDGRHHLITFEKDDE